ncbi:MAG: cysteine desulfurase [Clostridia bacterium]|jgi:cysteine desulfurase|nr:cysteine desulfurase [Clostridia bacterium]
MKVYFDNAATTRALPEVCDLMTNIYTQNYGNPSSVSIMGLEADNILKDSAKKLASLINCGPEEIYFTSGGTESDNWAVFGTAKGYIRSGKHIITTKTEHPAILNPFKVLESEGWDVDYLDVDEKGYINIKELSDTIRDDTVLVSIILINNETGTIQDAEKIGKSIKEKNKNTLFHLDAVQAFGKYRIDVKKWNVDMLSASGHKFNAPKGTGIFYLKKGLKVKPLLYGGGQQKNNRPGTENTAGAAAIAMAAEESYKDYDENTRKIRELKAHLFKGIKENISGVFINGDDFEKASPYVLNVGFENIRSEVLLHALEEKSIFVSAGSACNSKKKVQSSVLEAMGKNDEQIQGSVRFSFSRFSTIEEADYVISALKEIVPVLRKFQRR